MKKAGHLDPPVRLIFYYGRDRDRTDDLYRVKVALIPTELRARKDFEEYRMVREGCQTRGIGERAERARLFLQGFPVAALFDVDGQRDAELDDVLHLLTDS